LQEIEGRLTQLAVFGRLRAGYERLSAGKYAASGYLPKPLSAGLVMRLGSAPLLQTMGSMPGQIGFGFD